MTRPIIQVLLQGSVTLLLTALATAQQEVTAYTNARILPGGKPTISNATMVVSGGKILALGGADVKVPDGAKVIDCKGMTITPGLIDASFQSSNNQQDLNEQSAEVTPHLRILDNIDPEDPLFRRARNNGVTAVHVMPGTRNVIGGLGCVIKTYGSDPKSMVIKADASMRIVMGAEPSNGNRAIRGGRVNSMYYRRPTSRMGVIWSVRRAFYDAKEALTKTQGAPGDAPPSPGTQIMMQVLQGKLTAVTTARSEQDLRTALRIAEEFGYETVIDEAQDAYMVANELAEKNVVVMLGAPSAETVSGSAARDGSAPRSGTVAVLASKGIRFVITTGTNPSALPLIREAMFAHRFGLGPQQALDAITIEPAKLLGLDDRIGSLATGKDADFVIWSHDPLDPAAVAVSVHINGTSVSQPR
jgi:imidazolonepropionase-like amidohydrolase